MIQRLKRTRSVLLMAALALAIASPAAEAALPQRALILDTPLAIRSVSPARYLPAGLAADWDTTPEDARAPRSSTDADTSSVRSRLLEVMLGYEGLGYVPYVWGGGKIGTRTECEACRACISGKKRLSVERRLKACEPCRQCGVDCSHFANHVYKEAGLDFPYASTRDLARANAKKLREKYQLVNIGRDLSKAQPGDLLLHPRHVVMLLQVREGGRGDILHVSRSVSDRASRIGGIEIVRDQDLRKFRGRIVKILRHVRLLKDAAPELPKRDRRRQLLGQTLS